MFNRNLLVIRKNQIANKIHHYNFFRKEIVSIVSERFDEIKKDFDLVLDLGASLGEFSQANQNNHKIKTIIQADISQEILNKNPFNNKHLLVDENISFPENYFDAVVSIFYLHNINNIPKTIKNIFHILKQDGLFILAVPIVGSLNNLAESIMKAEIILTNSFNPRIHPFHSLQDLSNLLVKSGFSGIVATSEKIEIMYKNIDNIFKDLKGYGETNITKSYNKSLPKNFLNIFKKEFEKYFDKTTGHYPLVINTGIIIAWKE